MMWITALMLGLGWAIRGHFGHEWGASWAGGMAGLAILVTSKRENWHRRTPALAALSAIGWAIAGMASYGILIGYCRGTHFGNVLYGYTTLFIVGGLYGFMGGGLFGLGIESSDKKSPDWARLIVEMFVGGFLFWGFFMYQLEWYMTPPRSELWAGAAGASLALGWYLHREGFHKALRVAIYTMVGAGFGFAFGNLIQTFGASTGLSYNWWNVMEFTLGFCGGLALAWAVATSEWTETRTPSRSGNWLGLLFLFLLIPLINFIEAMKIERFEKLADGLGINDPHTYAVSQAWFGFVLLIIFLTLAVFLWKKSDNTKEPGTLINIVAGLFFSLSLFYLLDGYIVKGMFYSGLQLGDSSTAYLPIFIAALILFFFGRRLKIPEIIPVTEEESWKKWAILFAGVVIVLLLIAFISVNMHDGTLKFHERF